MSKKVCIVAISALLVAIWNTVVMAYPPCGDRQAPNQRSAFCRPVYTSNALLQLNADRPFGWLRDAPASNALPIAAIYPTHNASLVVVNDVEAVVHWDGYQWWWQVHALAEDRTGWIEQAAITGGPSIPIDDAPYVQADWVTPLAAQVEPGLAFLWLRNEPLSSGTITASIPAQSAITVLGNPQFDGVQWWWNIEYNHQTGYVEQSLITPTGNVIP